MKDDSFYIGRIIEHIDFILEHANGKSLRDLSADPVLIDSVMFRFIQIAENAHELSKEFLEKTPDLPWPQISGIRNRVVHAYDIVRLDIVYDTIRNDLEPLRDSLFACLRG